jgi:hypothetical protein
MYILYYASMLQCWHLVWIMVMTDYPCLWVGCHSIELVLAPWKESVTWHGSMTTLARGEAASIGLT